MSWDTTHINGKLRVSSMPYLYDISEGNVADHYPLRVFAHNSSQSTTLSVISNLGATKKYLPSAQTIKVVSDNSSDSSAGNGARTVFVTGQNSSFEPISETLTLTGTTVVPSINSYLRI